MIDTVLTGIQNAINQVRIDPYWELTAFVGEAVFGGRFILQWIMSEKKKQSYIPDFFWYMSIVGSMILLAYFVHKASLAMIINAKNCIAVALAASSLLTFLLPYSDLTSEMRSRINPTLLDLGVAIGSAVKMAGECHIDNRIMYTIGAAVKELNLLQSDIILGIPLSVKGKNIFYDRK